MHRAQSRGTELAGVLPPCASPVRFRHIADRHSNRDRLLDG